MSITGCQRHSRIPWIERDEGPQGKQALSNTNGINNLIVESISITVNEVLTYCAVLKIIVIGKRSGFTIISAPRHR